MKRRILQSIAVLIIILAGGFWCMQNVHAEGWETVEGGWFTTGVVSNIRLAFHPTTGEPYMAFSDYGTWKASVKKYSNGVWQSVGDDNFGPPFSSVDSLAINPKTGEPYVAIRDYTNGRKVTVMKFDGNSWQTVGNAGFGSEVFSDIILAFNPKTGEPCVAYESIMDKGYGWVHWQPAVMKFINDTWQAVGATTFTEGDTLGMALAFHPTTGEPYIAYSDSADSWKTNVKKFSKGSWQTVASPNLSVGMQQYTTLGFNPVSNELYMAYNDYGDSSNQHAAVIKLNGDSWQSVGGYNDFTGSSRYISLAFRPITGEPYVSYSDYSNDGKAIVKKFSDGSWHTLGASGLSNGRADYVSIMFNPISEEPYVSFWDVGNVGIRSSAIVMKYVGDTPPPVTPTHTVAYIPVKFSDGSASVPIDQLEQKAKQVTDYYNQQSYGAENIGWNFIRKENGDYYTLEHTLAWYSEHYPKDKNGDETAKWTQVREDALKLAGYYEDKLSDYHSNVVIVPEEMRSFANNLGGNKIITTSRDAFSTWAHELGHSLFSFGDYYNDNKCDYENSNGEINYWGLMGGGTLMNPTTPINSFNKVESGAGWLKYKNLQNGTTQINLLSDLNLGDEKVYRYEPTNSKNSVKSYVFEARDVSNEYQNDILKDNTVPTSYELDKNDGVEMYVVTNRINANTQKNKIFDIPHRTFFPLIGYDDRKITLLNGDNYSDIPNQVKFSLNKDSGGKFGIKIDDIHSKKIKIVEYLGNTYDIDNSDCTLDNPVFTSNKPDIDLHVVSQDGKRIGMNYDTGEYEMQIDGVSTSYNIPGGGPEWISIPNNVDVSYYLDTTPLKKWAEETGANVTNIKADFRVTTFDENGNRQDSEEMTVPIDLANPVTPLAIKANVEVNPKTLNLKSNGNWITAYVELPKDYDISQILGESVILNNQLKADKIEFGDFDSDGTIETMMKFDRTQVADILTTTNTKKVTINGDFMHDGIPLPFAGESFFNTINPGSNPKK